MSKEIYKDQSIITTINLVNTEISQQGLAKSQKNTMQNYMYRGIDGLYDLLSPIFAKHGLVIIPSALEHHREVAGQTKSGSNTYAVVVKMQYEICHIHNEQTKIAIFYGEAMDTSDKATNKAKTAAYKYMAFELFNIPIDGSENDADATNPEAKPKQPAKQHDVLNQKQLYTLLAEKQHIMKQDAIDKTKAAIESNVQETLSKVSDYLIKLGT